MKPAEKLDRRRRVAAAAAASLASLPLAGCLVMGYTSRGGFFIWPGSLVLLVILALLYFLLRGR